MKIAVNSRGLQKDRLEGIGWFTYETLKRITKSHPEHDFFFIFDRKFDESFIFSSNITPVILPPRTRHLSLWWIWFEWSMPILLKKIKPSIFLSLDGFIPLNNSIPSMAVIHDLSFVHRPDDLPFLFRNYCRTLFPRFARKANRIATVSNFSKMDLIRTYKIDEAKIDVVGCGVNEVFKPIPQEEKQSARNQYALGNRFFLYTGALHARKNIENLLKAFDLLKERLTDANDNAGIKLLLIGKPMFISKSIFEVHKQLRHRDDVIFTGRLETDELAKLTASAEALLLVSFFEGFGIPILEALNCDVPVIVSDRTSLPEVAGSAALYINPDSIESISTAMFRVISDYRLKQALIEKGKEERKRFSWDITADNLWKNIEKITHEQ